MSTQLQQILATPGDAGKTLQEFLAAHLGISKGKAKDLLDLRIVFVNGRRVWMAKHELKARDKIEVQLATTPTAVAQHMPKILYQDPDILVVDKTAGLLVNGSGSIEELLREKLKLPALEVVHRLDRDTSGCLLLAKNPEMREKLVALFGQREVTKVYHAIAAGRVPDGIREIRTPVDGEPALTRLERLDANPQASHLKLNIETGRTHQIRRHLLAIHHPVLGDKQYGARFQPAGHQAEIPRQMLHSAVLAFPHPTSGAAVRCIATLPPDFRGCLRSLHLH
jgi:23S rRNA pseudouridine1911/1915/1917 synthase